MADAISTSDRLNPDAHLSQPPALPSREASKPTEQPGLDKEAGKALEKIFVAAFDKQQGIADLSAIDAGLNNLSPEMVRPLLQYTDSRIALTKSQEKYHQYQQTFEDIRKAVLAKFPELTMPPPLKPALDRQKAVAKLLVSPLQPDVDTSEQERDLAHARVLRVEAQARFTKKDTDDLAALGNEDWDKFKNQANDLVLAVEARNQFANKDAAGLAKLDTKKWDALNAKANDLMDRLDAQIKKLEENATLTAEPRRLEINKAIEDLRWANIEIWTKLEQARALRRSQQNEKIADGDEATLKFFKSKPNYDTRPALSPTELKQLNQETQQDQAKAKEQIIKGRAAARDFMKAKDEILVNLDAKLAPRPAIRTETRPPTKRPEIVPPARFDQYTIKSAETAFEAMNTEGKWNAKIAKRYVDQLSLALSDTCKPRMSPFDTTSRPTPSARVDALYKLAKEGHYLANVELAKRYRAALENYKAQESLPSDVLASTLEISKQATDESGSWFAWPKERDGYEVSHFPQYSDREVTTLFNQTLEVFQKNAIAATREKLDSLAREMLHRIRQARNFETPRNV